MSHCSFFRDRNLDVTNDTDDNGENDNKTGVIFEIVQIISQINIVD